MAIVIGRLPAGVRILAMTTFARGVVIATSDGVYVVASGKLQKLEPTFA